jgi:DnaJ like chaperone protein
MGWFGKLTFGTLGLLFGGPLGAIAGAAMGHMLVDKKFGAPGQATRSIPGPEFGQAEQAQATYFISLFSILGKMSKIDGVVSRHWWSPFLTCCLKSRPQTAGCIRRKKMH